MLLLYTASAAIPDGRAATSSGPARGGRGHLTGGGGASHPRPCARHPAWRRGPAGRGRGHGRCARRSPRLARVAGERPGPGVGRTSSAPRSVKLFDSTVLIAHLRGVSEATQLLYEAVADGAAARILTSMSPTTSLPPPPTCSEPSC